MPGWKGYTNEFLNGVEEFVAFACQQAHLAKGKIRSPYSKCTNINYIMCDKVRVHVYKRGFVANYWYWTCHGENDPTSHRVFNNQASTSTMAESRNNEHLNRCMMLLV